MVRVLAFVHPAPGHTSPFVAVLRELATQSHDVCIALYTHNRSPDQLSGLATIALTPRDASGNELHLGFPDDDYSQLYGAPAALCLETVVRRLRPDVIVVDPILWGGMVAAEASGIPWATIAHSPCFFKGTGIDIRGPGIAPPRGPLSRAWYRFVYRRSAKAQTKALDAINDLRRSRSLHALDRADDLLLRPNAIIATTSEPFEYPRTDWPKNFHFVGPVWWEAPLRDDAPVLPPDDGRPLVLVVGSTVSAKDRHLRWDEKVLDGISRKDFRVLATLPGRTSQPQTHIYSYLPHSWVIPRVACVVCHGGPGIAHKALSSGVPLVVIPGAADRYEVARRVELSRVGVRLSVHDLSAISVNKAIRAAIAMRAEALRMAGIFATTGGASEAAGYLAALAK